MNDKLPFLRPDGNLSQCGDCRFFESITNTNAYGYTFDGRCLHPKNGGHHLTYSKAMPCFINERPDDFTQISLTEV